MVKEMDWQRGMDVLVQDSVRQHVWKKDMDSMNHCNGGECMGAYHE